VHETSSRGRGELMDGCGEVAALVSGAPGEIGIEPRRSSAGARGSARGEPRGDFG